MAIENDEKDQAELDRVSHGVLGNIDPAPSAKEHLGGGVSNTEESGEAEESMAGGSRHDRKIGRAHV